MENKMFLAKFATKNINQISHYLIYIRKFLKERKLELLLATPPIKFFSCIMDQDPILKDGQQLDFECAI